MSGPEAPTLAVEQINRELLNNLAGKTGRRDFLRDLAEALHPVCRFSWLFLTLRDLREGLLADYSTIHQKRLNPFAPVPLQSVTLALAETVQETGAPLIISDCVEHFLAESPPPVFQFSLASAIALPLMLNNEVFASLQLGYETRPDDLSRLADLAAGFSRTVAAALGVILLLERSRHRLPEPEPPAEAGRAWPASELHLDADLVFRSRSMRKVFQQVGVLTNLDVPVLLLGETGTGKSMIARHIHENSPRASGHFVRVNCPSLASGLFESEMFGHAKGSFTGATKNRVGRFELAHKGTLFLDEVAELSLDMQSKLLQVLDDSSFERVGESEPIMVDMRIVAATNVHVGEAISRGRLRGDLFHRVSVYTIELPPLRRRPEDIEPLARVLSAQSAARMVLPDLTYNQGILTTLSNYYWPGNTRELSNLMTRLVIVQNMRGELDSALVQEIIDQSESYFLAENASRTGRPAEPLPVGREGRAAEDGELESLAQMERRHILSVLKKTGGVIAGPRGAARILGLPRSTLLNRMKKLGLNGK
ncbi:MAG: sigma-54 dependent transcriptional regulator [Candidatus Adiutrix sp.]|jgi:transcriptional regulator with GAF, ATPase, and Fis domain|nr:sigma-54 dependent transcriptional regulator [Candidatus Adiutrix sp.]